jgi:predicted permease
MDRALLDLRDAVRSLIKAPGFSCVAVTTLAIGIGAVTALFNVVNGVLLKPLPYHDPGRIVSVLNQYAGRASFPNLAGGDVIDLGAGASRVTDPGAGGSGASAVFDAFAFYHGGEMGVQLAGHAEFVGIRLVHPDFFRVFAVAPLAGRTFEHNDSLRSAVVSLAFARRNFGAAQAALNKSVHIESRAYEIVGVMPAVMQFPAETDVWAAAPVEPENRNRTGHNYRVVARLAEGVSVEAANDRLSALAARMAEEFPVSNTGKTFQAVPLRETLITQVRLTLYILLGAVVLVLLIACANVANLMLARGSVRVREIAVRAALGAARRHIVSQLLIESLLLAAMACGVGVFLAYGATNAVLRLGASSIPSPRLNDVEMDWRVLAFGIGLSLATAVVFGLAPAVHASRADVRDALGHGGTRGPLGARGSSIRATLVIAQIALSYVLAIDAGLLVRSFISLTETPLGFRRAGILVMYAHAPANGSFFGHSGLDDYLRVGRFFDDVLGRLRQLPNVTAAGGVMGLPTGQYSSNGAYAVEGKQVYAGDFRTLPAAGFRLASPGYFDTLGIPLLRGRDFTDADVYDRPFVAIISQSLARQTFGDEDPLGHRIMCGLDQPDKWMTIVGVVGDVRQASPASQPGPELYMPLRQHPYAANEVQLVVRARVPPETLIGAVQRTVRAADPAVAMKFTTLDGSVENSIAAPRFRATLVSTFASLALLLALAGIYAVMSYTTAQRMSEFALRVALGAKSGDLVRLVLARAGLLAVIGAVAGLVLALATSRVLANLLFGIVRTDLITYAGVLLTATPLIVAAAAMPALRAARVDPIVALKAE